jgi:hypothetical protein
MRDEVGLVRALVMDRQRPHVGRIAEGSRRVGGEPPPEHRRGAPRLELGFLPAVHER